MPKRSAGIVLFRRRDGQLQVFLVHPGGPFFAKKDAGVWSVPKGEYGEGEDPIDVARRDREDLPCKRPRDQHKAFRPFCWRSS